GTEALPAGRANRHGLSYPSRYRRGTASAVVVIVASSSVRAAAPATRPSPWPGGRVAAGWKLPPHRPFSWRGGAISVALSGNSAVGPKANAMNTVIEKAKQIFLTAAKDGTVHIHDATIGHAVERSVAAAPARGQKALAPWKLDEAIAAYHKAVGLDLNDAMTHRN